MPLRNRIRTTLRKLPPPRDRAAIEAARAVRTLVTGKAEPRVVPLERRIEAAFASGRPKRIAKVLSELHELQARVEHLASPPSTPADVRLSETSGAQSLQFMIDLLPHIQKLIGTYPRGHRFTVLDVGPGTGLGTELLAELYSSGRLGYRMKVSVIDISATFRNYLRAVAPRVRFTLGDVFDHTRRYDIVIASHVIEHVDDPVAFCQRLQELARIAVFVVAPFNEPADKLTRGHINVIDEATVTALKPTSHVLVNSVSWGAMFDPPYEMLIAELPGMAEA